MANPNSNQNLNQANQEDLLKKAKADVRTNAALMKKSLDKNEFLDGLKHAATMLNELCTSNLSPKSYYDLYMTVTDELRHLEMYMVEEFERGFKCDDLYELVQYNSQIIPRLYLLITVGTVYIKIKEYPRKIILRDLVEMCRGVQHPLRGLFLRNYLLQCTKSLLPDCEPSAQSGVALTNETFESSNFDNGSVSDAIEFILLNFSEMNKLWVRMQYQGHTKFKEKREQERRELRLLVGTNLVRLSELEFLNTNLYSTNVLPKILEQAVNCNDAIAQEYLLECIIQVFPDEFHINTLETYLKSCADLHEDVNIKNIITALVDRFTKNSAIKNETELGLFDIFSKQITSIVTSRQNMPVQDIVCLYTSLLNLAIKCYTDRFDYIDNVLDMTATVFKNMNLDKIESNTAVSKELIKMLKIPIEVFKNVLTILKLANYQRLYENLDYVGRKFMCQSLVNSAIDNENLISTSEEVESFLKLISPLITDPSDKPSDYEQDHEDFIEEQTLVAKLVHQMHSEDLDQQLIILKTAAKQFCLSGKERLQLTLAAVVFEAYRLAARYKDAANEDELWHKKCDKIFKFCFQMIDHMLKAQLPPELMFRLFLQGGIALADIAYENCENITYEFISQAIILYEEEITSNHFSAITQIISTCQKILHVFGEENCDALRLNCVNRAAKLLKKPDQCRAVALCSHLFWDCEKRLDGTSLREPQKVVECLKRCLKIAAQCVDPAAQFELNVEVLTYFMHYYEKKNEKITREMLEELVNKLKEDAESIDINADTKLTMDNFERTIAYIKPKLN